MLKSVFINNEKTSRSIIVGSDLLKEFFVHQYSEWVGIKGQANYFVIRNTTSTIDDSQNVQHK